MRFYRGLLQEAIRQHRDKLVVERVVLSVGDDALRNAFDWKLSRFDTDYDKLEHWQIIDVPVCSDLMGQNVFVIPLYYRKFSDPPQPNPMALHQKWQSIFNDSTTLDKLKTGAKQTLKDNMEQQFSDMVKLLEAESAPQKITDEIEQYQNPNNLKQLNVIDFIRFMQIISMQFPNSHDRVNSCIVSVLRYLNSVDVEGSTTLRELWMSKLHTDGSKACYYVLDEEKIKDWRNRGIAPSFVMFGKSNKDGQEEWKIVILSDVHYPFVTSRVRYITSGSPGFETYCAVHRTLRQESRSFLHREA